MLYLVPTPIGNMDDMTHRAIQVLQSVKYILAEDTRTSSKLMQHFKISTQLRPFHAFNEHKVLRPIIQDLESGVDIALISDAGTPGISDPGFLLTRACREAGVEVSCLPGATAFVPALAASGLPSDSFVFDGFLPHKKGKQSRIQYLAALPHTFIVYESPHRLVKTLQMLLVYCGTERKACVAREISKMHEDIRTDTIQNLLDHYSALDKVRGEIVLIVEGHRTEPKNKSTNDAKD
jgi:16S rRNA (cytidine1402-2'-O)-methyltransferase